MVKKKATKKPKSQNLAFRVTQLERRNAIIESRIDALHEKIFQCGLRQEEIEQMCATFLLKISKLMV